MKRLVSLYLIAACLIGFTQTLVAEDSAEGKNVEPKFSMATLPETPLKAALAALPAQAQAQALATMSALAIPAADIEHLGVDSTGKLYYADNFNPVPSFSERSFNRVFSGITSAEVFSLHSKPGAANVLFIDVDGHTITGTQWNVGRVDPFYARPYDADGVSSSFSPTELDAIAEIWYRVAEDFAMFDVDITTEDPGTMGPNTGRILITSNTDQNGELMPRHDAGGVAYLDVFGDSFYSPALVYFDNVVINSYPPYVAEVASHEAGHNMGLSHDGSTTVEYYRGHGSGAVSWAPIMGGGLHDNVTQWSKGEYENANNTQDDINIIIGKLGERADDHADTLPGATVLQVLSDGGILSTTPQIDPFNTIPTNKGIINSASDIDSFYFSTGSGNINIVVTPSWQAWGHNGFDRGTNLDIEAALYDVNGNEILRDDPIDETNAIVSTTVSAGDYYLVIKGVGNNQSPYSDYGSQGQYYITGSVPLDDTTPPTPDPMSFAVAPVANNPNSVTMTASIATDESGGPVEYYFTSATAGDSGWLTWPDYTANGLSAATNYTWQVKARDAAGNETALSAPASATTGSGMPIPVQPSGDISTADPTYAWMGDSNATEFLVQIFDRTLFTTIYNSTHSAESVCSSGSCSITPTDASLSQGVNHYWRVQARSAAGWSGWTNKISFSYLESVPGVVTPQAPLGDITAATPNYQWLQEGSATEYRLIIFDRVSSTLIYDVTHTAAGICASGTCSITPAGASLSIGANHYWRIRAKNGSGWGDWTDKTRFNLLQAGPGVVTPLAPMGDVTTANPTYQWLQESGATDYRLIIHDRVSFTLIYDVTHSAGSVCVSGTCSITPAATLPTGANHYWRIRAKNATGWGDWSSKVDFDVLEAIPGVVGPVAPTGNVTTANITFEWQKDDAATDYRLIVYDRVLSTLINDGTYPEAFLCSSETCSITLVSANLSIGNNHYWRVRAKNASGWGDWTSKIKFNYLDVPPGVAAPLAPMGDITTADSTFEWQEDTGATDYRLIIYDRMLSTLIHDELYSAANVCSSGTCSITPAGASLSLGNNHYWRVRAKNTAGWGDWTGKVIFNHVDAVPGVVTPLAPMGNITTSNPTYDWQEDDGATEYRLIIYDRVSFTLIYDLTHTAASVCSSGTCSITPSSASLPLGNNHYWRVRAKNASGWGDWTNKVIFNLLDV